MTAEPRADRCSRLFSISGRVQGVGFRNFVRMHALTLGLAGYARNLVDGQVEVLACGHPDAIDRLRGHLHKGPVWSEVRGVEEREAPGIGYDEFFIR